MTTKDQQAAEFAARLKALVEKKEVVQWAMLRAMRAETDAMTQSVDRSHALLPHMDALECALREKIRKVWGQKLAVIVYNGQFLLLLRLYANQFVIIEMASLPPEFSTDSDSSILSEVMSKLDEPYSLNGNSVTTLNGGIASLSF